MSNIRERRLEQALSQLVQCTLSSFQEEDDATTQDQFDRALDHARNTLESDAIPTATTDVNHVYELIRRNLIRDHDTPDAALRFNNLYSRLIAHPLLSQKWAHLFLLLQLSDSSTNNHPNAQSSKPVSRSSNEPNSPALPNNSSKRPSRLESPVYDEAFSRQGLSRVILKDDIANSSPYAQPKTKWDIFSRAQEPHQRGISSAISPKQLPQIQPSEAALLRDLPFTLQGLSSTNLAFAGTDTLRLPSTLPVSIIALLHSLAEPSLLYKSLCAFLETNEGSLIGQSMRAAIGVEMRSYLGLVATLESQIRRALAVLDESQPKQGLGKAGVTLRRCVIWTREATMGLRLMCVVVKESESRKGGQLISLIHSFSSSHGDPFVGSFAERLLSHVTKPFYDMLRLWIYDGELSDPYHEFFVLEQQPSAADDAVGKGHATSVWEDKYTLDATQIPSIITEDFARKVFLIGKSLNFIRTACGDAAWVDSYSKSTSRELRYGDSAARAVLETSIDEAYKTVMARLIYLMNTKFKLLEHLTALKKYLLLGQGDFIALLMESLASNLDRPANSQYRHTLTAQLEHAIRNSNAQFDSPDVLRRLDARMLELSHGEIGWDVFTLEYKVDAPVDVIVTPYAAKQYLKVFNFLWRIKRVEFALGSTWRRCMTGSRGVLGAVADRLGNEWKVARCVVAEMIHFVVQLQYYILFEVIEASWAQLVKALSDPTATLDDLVSAHARYLRAITRKGLLSSGAGGSNGGSSSASSVALDFTSQLHELLKTMLAYRDAVDGLYSFSVADYTRRQERGARIERRTKAGKWGVTERDDEQDDAAARAPLPALLQAGKAGATGTGASAAEDATTLAALRKRLDELAADFRARVCGLLGDLAYQPETDMRFLGVVMNFNDTYKVVRRSRRKAGEKRDKGKEREKTTPAPTAAAGEG